MSDIVARLLADLPAQEVRWSRSALIAIMGLPGAGKTEIANYLAERYPLVKLSTDYIRLKYGLASGPATHEVMYGVAGKLLAEKASLVLDGIHLGRHNRDQARTVANEYKAYAAIIYATASREIIEERLQQRLRQSQRTANDGKYVITPGHFAAIASYLEEPADDEEVFVVDTSHDAIDKQMSDLEHLLRHLLTGSHL